MNPTVIGEALVDVLASGITPAQEFVGGSPLNVAVSLARLGYPGTLISRWGADDKGRKIEVYLEENNVKYIGGADDEATVIAHGILDPAGGAAFAFNAYWQMPTIGPELPQDVELVHTGSIATLFSPEELLPLLSAARTHATISYDPNLRPSLVTNHSQTVAEVERFVAQADVVRVSGIDLKWMYPMRSVKGICASLARHGPGHRCVHRRITWVLGHRPGRRCRIYRGTCGSHRHRGRWRYLHRGVAVLACRARHDRCIQPRKTGQTADQRTLAGPRICGQSIGGHGATSWR